MCGDWKWYPRVAQNWESLFEEWDTPACCDLARTALRELNEEVRLKLADLHRSDRQMDGVPPFDRPFIAAAYNLRYGRDLNFYCCYRTKLTTDQIAGRKASPRDA